MTVSVSGAGRVVSTPAGIDCSATCSATFPVGTRVELGAIATSFVSLFGGWGGECGVSPSDPCSFIADGPKSVTATFHDLVGLRPPRVTILLPFPNEFFQRAADVVVQGLAEAGGSLGAFCVKAGGRRDVFPTDCDQLASVRNGRFRTTVGGLTPGRHTLIAWVRDTFGRFHSDAVPVEVASAASGVDIMATGVEVTQGIQKHGWYTVRRSAPFTEARYDGVDLQRSGKTVVRVYARAIAPVRLSIAGVRGVKALLYGWRERGGRFEQLPGSPLRPGFEPGTVPTRATEYSPRANPYAAYNFTLPQTWTSGTIRLTATVNPADLAPSFPEASGQHANNNFVLTGIAFTPTRPVRIAAVKVCYRREPYTDSAPLVCPAPAGTVFADTENLTPTVVERPSFTLDGYLGMIDATAVARCDAGDVRAGRCRGRTGREADDYPRRTGELFDRVVAWAERYPGAQADNVSAVGVQTGLTNGAAYPRPRSLLGWFDVREAIVEGAYGRTSVAHEFFHTIGFLHASNCGAAGELEVVGGWPTDFRGQIQGIGLERRGSAPYPVIAPGYRTPPAQAAQLDEVVDLMSYCWGHDQERHWISTRYWNDAIGKFRAGPAVRARRRARADVPTLRIVAAVGSEAGITLVRPAAGQPAPSLAASPYRVVVRDALGAVLWDVGAVTQRLHVDGGPGLEYVATEVPAAGAASIDLVGHGLVLTSRRRSAHAPVVELLGPAGGARVPGSGNLAVRWRATDADADPLTAAVDYSADDGTTWRPLTVAVAGDSASLPGDLLTASRRARVRVVVNDGFNETTVVSEPFVASGNPPRVRIRDPRARTTVRGDAPLRLSGDAYDDAARAVPAGRLRWLLGRRTLGFGPAITATGLPPGRRRVDLVATDSAGRTGRASVVVRVVPVAPLFLGLRAPGHIGVRAGTIRVRVGATVPATLRVSGRAHAVGRRPRTIRVRVRPGRTPLVVPLRLTASGRSTTVRVRIRRG